MPTSISELTRIRNTYDKRFAGRRHTFYDAGSVFLAQQTERAFIALLREHHLAPLDNIKLLDVGTAGGFFLRELLKYGARVSNLVGVDLWHTLLCEGHATLPALGLVCASASNLPFPNDTFDIITQQTMFSTVLDNKARASIAREMLRVLKPEGRIFSYDFRFKRPGDQDVCRIDGRELRRLFPGTKVVLTSVGLPPQIARFLAPRSQRLCDAIGAVWPIGTHYWAAISKT